MVKWVFFIRGSCRGGSSVSGHVMGVGCCGFYFCGCGLIFLGSCGLILVVLFVGSVKWWLTGGDGGLCEAVLDWWWRL